MKKLLFVAALVLLQVAGVTQTQVKEKYPLVYETIKTKAALEWPGDYSMQKYQITKQSDAFAEFISLRANSNVSDEVYSPIVVNAMDNWAKSGWFDCFGRYGKGEVDKKFACLEADWNMVVYTIKKQVKAYQEIR